TLLLGLENWVNSLDRIAPAWNEPGGDTNLTVAALKPLAAEGQQKSEYETLYRWIDACLRLDKGTVDELAGTTLSAADWKTKAAFWLDNHLVAVQPLEYSTYLSSAGRSEPIVSFSCLVFPRQPDNEKYRPGPRDYSYYFSSQTQTY